MNQGSALPDCENCAGTRYVLVDKRETRAIVQNMNLGKHYEAWSEQTRGTISVSFRDVDDIGYMDRITDTTLEVSFSQIVYPVTSVRNDEPVLFSFLTYTPLRTTHVLKFENSQTRLTPLLLRQTVDQEFWDYFVENNKIFFNPMSINQHDGISVRYVHHPVYHVIDLTRKKMSSQDEACAGKTDIDGFKRMPVHAIAREAHYLWDADNLEGTKLFDNTQYPESE